MDAPVKWTDNVLAQHKVPEVAVGGRGVSRHIPHSAVVRLTLVRDLQRQFGIGVATALTMTVPLLDPLGNGVLRRGLATISVDRVSLNKLVDARLATALESAPSPRRGRPPRRA